MGYQLSNLPSFSSRRDNPLLYRQWLRNHDHVQNVMQCTYIETRYDMSKSASISARIDPKIKQRAETIFKKLGLTASQAITLFYKQVEMRNGLPFPVEIPNETTLKALKETQDNERLPRFETAEALYKDLGI